MTHNLLLLQATTPDAETVGKIVLWLFLSIPLLEKIWGWLSGAGKKREEAVQQKLAHLEESISEFVDEEALEKRFTTIEDKHKITAAEVVNQHNTLMEYLRERERLSGYFDGSIKQLQKDVLTLEPMPGRVANLEAKFDTLNERIGSLKEMQQELKNDVKDNKREILDAIAKIH